MSSRERFMTAIRLGRPDRVPVCPDISNMIPCRLTGKPFWEIYAHANPPLWKAYLAALDYFKFDGWVNYGGVEWKFKTPVEHVTRVVSHDDERLIESHVHRTPAGDLEDVVLYQRDNPPTAIKRFVDDIEADLPKLRYLFEEPIGYDDSTFREIQARAGEKGIACIGCGTPGFQEYFWLLNGGLEAVTYAYYDHPDAMEELRLMSHRMYVKQAEMLCDIKPDCICTGGSGSITLQSPDLWRKLSLPTLKEICRLAKQAGVLTMVHCCGKERCLVEACAEETDLNCVNPLEIPPMGDCNLAELKRSFGKKISLMGNLHTTDVMLKGTPADVERAARKAIDDAAADGGFILSTGDQCGRDTPDENIFKLVEVAETYGRYD
jgi:uroporphyrinogen decarboxylase